MCVCVVGTTQACACVLVMCPEPLRLEAPPRPSERASRPPPRWRVTRARGRAGGRAAMPSSQEDASEQCAVRRKEIQAVLRRADDRWRELEGRLHATEEEVLKHSCEALKEPLGLQSSDLEKWTEGGLRRKVRGRLESLILAPLAARMRQQVCLSSETSSQLPADTDEASCHVLDDIAECWEDEVEPLLLAAGVADAKIERRARRKAKIPGSAPDLKVEAQERPAIWSKALRALEALMPPILRLAGFLEAEVSASAMDSLVSAAQAIVSRAVCDWRFQRCAVEFDQLDGWWQGAKAALQKREALWEELQQEEGLFVRRVERGVELLRAARNRYTVSADFGASPVVNLAAGQVEPGTAHQCSAEQVAVLADVVKDMRTRLRPIRDSAAWRVVDAAKALQRRHRGGATGGAQRESTLWQRMSRQEGARELTQALTHDEDTTMDLSDPADVALVFMQRLDRLKAVFGELRDFLKTQSPSDAGEALAGHMEQLLQAASVAGEDVLALLDDPSDEGVAAWRAQWESWSVAFDGPQLHKAACSLVLRPDSSLSAEDRRARRRHLALLRGVEVFVGDGKLRLGLVAPMDLGPPGAAEAAAASSSAERRERSAEAAVDLPPSLPAASGDGALLDQFSPRGAAPPRYAPPRRTLRQEAPETDDSAPAASPAKAPAAATDEQLQVETPPVAQHPVDAAPVALPQGAEEPSACAAESAMMTQPSTAESSGTRPSTPSWLLPPWPRPDTPSLAGSWLRPETPSTVCDDAELSAALPKVKFVDGQRVTLRLGMGARLPPLRLAK